MPFVGQPYHKNNSSMVTGLKIFKVFSDENRLLNLLVNETSIFGIKTLRVDLIGVSKWKLTHIKVSNFVIEQNILTLHQ